MLWPKKTPWNVQTADVMAPEKLEKETPQKAQKSQVRLLGFVRCQHSKLPPAGIVAAFVPPRTAQRARIIGFGNANGRFLRQHGCVANTHVTPTELCSYHFQRCGVSALELNTNNRASTRGGQVIMLFNIKLAKFFLDFFSSGNQFRSSSGTLT